MAAGLPGACCFQVVDIQKEGKEGTTTVSQAEKEAAQKAAEAAAAAPVAVTATGTTKVLEPPEPEKYTVLAQTECNKCVLGFALIWNHAPLMKMPEALGYALQSWFSC